MEETMECIKIEEVLVGEALVGEGNELAHIELLMGPRGSHAEAAFCNALTNQKRGDNSLLALVAPNLMAKPYTVMYNKVEITNGDQATQMFGPAQRGVARAVVDSVISGVIPKAEVENIFIAVGVFIHWEATDDAKIQDFNYEATKLAIERAIRREPSIDEVISQEHKVQHPFAAHD
jgi:5,6,7,8-tetrahydromethanopterin hydro-lyase